MLGEDVHGLLCDLQERGNFWDRHDLVVGLHRTPPFLPEPCSIGQDQPRNSIIREELESYLPIRQPLRPLPRFEVAEGPYWLKSLTTI